MVTVALIGADGAGKTTIGHRLEKESTLPMKYIYMGENPESGNHTLPTTRMILKVKRALGKSSHDGWTARSDAVEGSTQKFFEACPFRTEVESANRASVGRGMVSAVSRLVLGPQAGRQAEKGDAIWKAQ